MSVCNENLPNLAFDAHFVSISIDFVFLCFIKQAFCFDFNRFCFPLFHKASALFRFRFPFASKPSPHRQMPPLASTAVANHRSRERSTLASRRGSIRGSALHWRNPAEVAIQAIPVVRSEWSDCSPAIGKSREIFAGKGRRFNLPTTGRSTPRSSEIARGKVRPFAGAVRHTDASRLLGASTERGPHVKPQRRISNLLISKGRFQQGGSIPPFLVGGLPGRAPWRRVHVAQ